MTTPTQPVRRLLTVDEAAERLRKTPEQMRWMRREGKGPKSALIGGRIFFDADGVEEFINAAFEASA